MRALKVIAAAAIAALLASSIVALAGSNVFVTAIGDLAFPFVPPSNQGATPGSIDNMTIGAVTPEAGTFTKLADQQAGTFTLNGATPVSVTATGITASSQVLMTLKTIGGTLGTYPQVKTITPGAGFTVAGAASDTSVYNYAILN